MDDETRREVLMDAQGDHAETDISNRRQFITTQTEEKERAALHDVVENKKDGVQCRLCSFTATCLARLRIHTRQHLINQVCGCGEMSHRRDTILKHIAKERSGTQFGTKGCRDRLVYEVDADSFPEFRRLTNNPAIEFLPLKPCTNNPTDNKINSQDAPTAEVREEAMDVTETNLSAPVQTLPNPNISMEKSKDPVQSVPPPHTSMEKSNGPAPVATGEAALSRLERKAAKKAHKEEKRARKRNKKLAKRLALAVQSVHLPPAEETPKKDSKPSKLGRAEARREEKPKRAPCMASRATADRDYPRQMTDLRRRLNRRKETLAALRTTALESTAPPKAAVSTPRAPEEPSYQQFPVLPRQPMDYASAVMPVAAVAGQALAASTQQAAYGPRVADPTLLAQILDAEVESLDVYRWVLTHCPNSTLEARLDVLTQKMSTARRRAACTQSRPLDQAEIPEAKRRKF